MSLNNTFCVLRQRAISVEFLLASRQKIKKDFMKKNNIKFEHIDNIHFSNPLYACQKVKKTLRSIDFAKNLRLEVK